MIRALCGLAMFATLATGCGPDWVEDSELGAVQQETVCGATDESQFVNEYRGDLGRPVSFVKAFKDFVGAMASSKTSGKYCSGALVSDNLFLTAAHCLGTSTVGHYVAFNYEKDAATSKLAPQTFFRIEAVVEEKRGGLDYAIVRLEGSPGSEFGIAEVRTTALAAREVLTIIGHPAGKPKMVEVGHLKSVSGNFLSYSDLDTLGGNSGSAVLDADGKVVGVHTLGGCSSSGGANRGVRMTKIAAVSSVL